MGVQHQLTAIQTEDHRPRVATIVKPGPSPCPLVRIDTDQGVYGLGEVRTAPAQRMPCF